MSLYLAVELCALAIPLAFSFDRKVAYFRMWPFLLPAILVNAIIFIAIDIYFTSRGTWGFNPEYHSSLMFSGLPAEELLFFIIIPYCSLFVHYVFIAYLPETAIGRRTTGIISLVLSAMFIILAVISSSRSYTSFYLVLSAGVILVAWLADTSILSRFYITFLIILVPFFVVNGILTGTFIEGSVFWYNSAEISGLKLLSIPVEDALFGFCLVLLNLVIAETFRKLMKR